MALVKPRKMPGALELLPSEQIELQRMTDVIRTEFERFGFVPVSTPAMELVEMLLTKSGGETDRQVYLAQSSGARSQGADPELALRFDLTVPLARYVAEHQAELVFPFRRYQIQPVWRGETPQRGRFREFLQCDIDVINRDQLSIRYDAEMPAVIAAIFTRLDFGDFTIRINNRRFLRGIMFDAGIDDEAQQAEVLRTLDRRERSGIKAVGAGLDRLGLEPEVKAKFMEIAERGPVKGSEARSLLDDVVVESQLGGEGREELATVLALVEKEGVDPARVAIDLSIARGLDYYTGTVYETTLDAHPEVGSICSGGRYDDLAGLFTSSRLPGVGISIGLTRLFWQLREAGLVAPEASTVMVLVTLIDDHGLDAALELAARLRAAGINTQVNLEPQRLSHQLRQADRMRIPVVVIAGEEERRRATVNLRHLPSQTQIEVRAGEVVEAVRGWL